MKHKFLLCPYDGFKIRIYSSRYVDFVIKNSEKFNLSSEEKLFELQEQSTVEAKESNSRSTILRSYVENPNAIDEKFKIDGDHNGFNIKIRKNKIKGMYVEIGGSFHKHFYNGQNFEHFYWKDFLSVYSQFLEMFSLEGTTITVVNLEVGINVKTLPHWGINARAICRRILFFNPPSNSREMNQKQYRNNGMGWISQHVNYWQKVYDKIPKFGIKKIDDLIRLEKKHIKSGPLKKLGIASLSDLLKPEVVEVLITDLFKTLNKLIIKQPSLSDNPSLTTDEYKFLSDYNSDECWDEAYNNVKQFDKEIRKRYQKLIIKYSPFDLKQELLNEARYLLNQKE